MPELTVSEAIGSFLNRMASNHRPSTIRIYKYALENFVKFLRKRELAPETLKVSQISENWVEGYISYLNHLSPSTGQNYLRTVIDWYKYLEMEGLTKTNVFISTSLNKLVR